jgi:hypothetical protein
MWFCIHAGSLTQAQEHSKHQRNNQYLEISKSGQVVE